MAQYAHFYWNDINLTIKLYDKCLELKPNNGKRLTDYGASLIYFGRYHKAIKIILKCKKLEYFDEGRWQFLLGLSYWYIQDFGKSLFNTKLSYNTDSGFHNRLIMIAMLHIRNKKFDKAQKYLRKLKESL